jgi:hypothetical protein
MSAKSIGELNKDAKKFLLEAKTVYDLGDDATPEQLDLAATKTADAEKIILELEKYANRAEALKTINRIENTVADLRTNVDRPHMGQDGASLRGGNAPDHEIKTAGELILGDANFQDWLKTVAPHGHIPNNLKTTSPTIELKTLYTTAGDITASRPLLGQADRRDGVVPLGWAQLVLRDLMTNLTTNSDLVEVVREKTRTNNAAFVAEASDTSGSTGIKPESAVEYEVAQAAVQTIAHWIPASSRVLSDARQLAGVIDAFLRMGLEQAKEQAFLVGNGTSPAFYGINFAPNILTQAYTTSPLITTRKSRTKLKVTGKAIPNGWVFHPNDWETLDLTVDNEARYHFGGPLSMGTPRLWGLPVIESEYQSEGYAMLGDFRQAVVYDREQTGIRIGNQHMDFFVRNLVAILAEARLAFHIQRPSSFLRADVVS